MFPSRIQLSKKTWDKLQYLQTQTKVTPNVMARVAMMLALRDTRTIILNTSKPEQTHPINRDVLFGEDEDVYYALMMQFVHEQEIDADIQDLVRSLIDSGLHKLGHMRKFSDFYSVF